MKTKNMIFDLRDNIKFYKTIL